MQACSSRNMHACPWQQSCGAPPGPSVDSPCAPARAPAPPARAQGPEALRQSAPRASSDCRQMLRS
eukprot:354314-Chlamydomonas_euryale.AAC.31